MEFLSTILPIILYIVAIILLIVFTIVGIKLVNLLDRIDDLVDNVEEKVDSFNGAISIMSKAANGIATFGDSMIVGISSIVSKVFNKKSKEEEKFYE